MESLELEAYGLSEMSGTEALNIDGGCGEFFWCMDRISYEAEKAWDDFSAGFSAGFADARSRNSFD